MTRDELAGLAYLVPVVLALLMLGFVFGLAVGIST